ncbi:MAG: T9SS type A sorting domain-containing protein [Cryomorphaceae bacterium]
MRKLISIGLVLILCKSFYGQSVDTTFILVLGGVNKEEPVDIFELDSSHALLVANTGSFGAGGADLYFAKVSTNAEVDTSWTWGGATQDHAIQSIKIASTIYTLGYRNSFDNPDYKYFLLAMDKEGDVQWTSILEEYSAEHSYSIGKLNGQPIVLHCDESLMTMSEIGTNTSLEQLESWQFPNPLQVSHVTTFDSVVYVSSIHGAEGEQRIVLSRLERAGTWDTLVVRSEDFYAVSNPIAVVSDSGDVSLLFNSLEHPDSVWNINLVGYDQQLNMKWEASYHKPMSDYVRDAIFNEAGEIAFVGFINSFGENGDFAFARYDSSGTYLDLRTLGGLDVDQGMCLIENANGGYWLFGQTEGFGSQMGDLLVYYTNAAGITSSNAYIRVVDQIQLQTGVDQTLRSLRGFPFPNPLKSGEPLSILTEDIGIERIDFYDVLGRKLWEKKFHRVEGGIEVDTERIGAGTYYLVLFSKSGEKSDAIRIVIHE